MSELIPGVRESSRKTKQNNISLTIDSPENKIHEHQITCLVVTKFPNNCAVYQVAAAAAEVAFNPQGQDCLK